MRLAVDSSVVLDAFDRLTPDARDLFERSKNGEVELALSRTFDDEVRRGHKDDPLWSHIAGLTRLPRPSAIWDRRRWDEAVWDYTGLNGQLAVGKGDAAGAHAIRDEEHVESAQAWRADAFVTSDAGLLRKRELLGVRMIDAARALAELRGETL
jgi:hypothetical protein